MTSRRGGTSAVIRKSGGNIAREREHTSGDENGRAVEPAVGQIAQRAIGVL